MPFSIFTQKGIQVYALCFMLYALCFMLYALCGTLVNLGICATAA